MKEKETAAGRAANREILSDDGRGFAEAFAIGTPKTGHMPAAGDAAERVFPFESVLALMHLPHSRFGDGGTRRRRVRGGVAKTKRKAVARAVGRRPRIPAVPSDADKKG